MVVNSNPFLARPEELVKSPQGKDLDRAASDEFIYGPNPFAADKTFEQPMSGIREWAGVSNSATAHDPSPIEEPRHEQLPWERKAAEIELRTRELQRREAELQKRERPMTGELQKNWPSFYPVIVHDIEMELPLSAQDLANRSYFIWKMTAVAYALNLAASVLMLFSGVPGYSSLSGTIFAAVYMFVFPALAFFSWQVSLYRALKFDSSFWFILYFFSFGLQILFYGFLVAGIFNGGGGGVIGMLDMFTHGRLLAGILSAVCTAAIGMCLFMGIYLIKSVVSHFRSGGHSVERAGAEAGKSIGQNETVRRTAKETVLNAV